MLVVARGAEHALVGEHTHVEHLVGGVWPDRRDRTDFVVREVGGHVRLSRQSQLVAAHIERGRSLAQVEHVRCRNDRERVAGRGVQHDRLGGLLGGEMRGSCLGRGGLAVGVLDQLDVHVVVSQIALESSTVRPRHSNTRVLRLARCPRRGGAGLRKVAFARAGRSLKAWLNR